jgi:hypothetical protein
MSERMAAFQEKTLLSMAQVPHASHPAMQNVSSSNQHLDLLGSIPTPAHNSQLLLPQTQTLAPMQAPMYAEPMPHAQSMAPMQATIYTHKLFQLLKQFSLGR